MAYDRLVVDFIACAVVQVRTQSLNASSESNLRASSKTCNAGFLRPVPSSLKPSAVACTLVSFRPGLLLAGFASACSQVVRKLLNCSQYVLSTDM